MRILNLGAGVQSAYCLACGNECSTTMVDFGFGYTEVGSHGQTHSQLAEVSDCCEADVSHDPRTDTAKRE